MRGFFVYNSMEIIGIILLVLVGTYLFIGLCIYLWWLIDEYNKTINKYKYDSTRDKLDGIYFTIKWGAILIIIWPFVLFDNKKYK